jgi:glycosyltransferase involved in cell wall biosynthesis
VARFLHLITSLEGGGTENFLYQVISRSPAGHQHRVLYLKKNGVFGQRLRRIGISVEKAGMPWRLAAALGRERPDVLHTCLFRAHQLGRIFGERAGIPCIVSSQRSIDGWAGSWQQGLDAWTLPKCHLVVANSAAAQRLVEARRGSSPRPSVVRIENGIDMSAFSRQDRFAARLAYKLPLDALVGGTLMRLHSEKGADRLPALARELLSAKDRLHLIIGGIGPLAKKVQRETAGKPWSSRLHWIGWEDNTSRFLSAIDFFFSVSREESFPQTLLEASALGIPWIAPAVGGTEELRSVASAGVTYTAERPQAAAGAVFQVIRLLNEYKRQAEQVAPTVRARFSLSRMVEQFYGAVEQRISSRR